MKNESEIYRLKMAVAEDCTNAARNILMGWGGEVPKMDVAEFFLSQAQKHLEHLKKVLNGNL